MAWLLTHMWIALAGVGLFSLLFGWSMRGIMLVGKLRTARVDRDIARTELDQAKAEIEGLYAAQRNTVPGSVAPATIADPSLRAELNVREKRLSELSAELSRSKAELQSLKSGAGRGAAPVAPKMASDQTEPSLLWRNRHLESRVQHLEASLHEQASAPVQAVSAPVAAAAAAVSAAPAVDQAEMDKLKWQADFFKQRVETLEAELSAQPVVSPAAEPVAAPIESDDAGEELARLRWRNRFLEGRLAYFEGDAAPEDAAAPEVAELVDLEVEAEDAPEDEEDVMSATDAILQELEEADAAADAEEGEYDEELDELEDDAEDEFEDDLDDEEEADELVDENADPEDGDDELELEDDAEIDDEDEAEADEESDEDAEDHDAFDEESDDEDPDAEDDDGLESDEDEDEDEDALEGEESDEEDSDDEDSDVDEDDVEEDDLEDDDLEDVDSEEDDAVESDDAEEVDEDALDDADEEDEGELDEESDEDGDDELDEDEAEDPEDDEDEVADELPAERPIALPKAVGGAPDDLTIIGGIGPKIQEVLNELGIFHYDQIAAWTPANITWVDNHLNFSGRIAREGWVEQAAILSGDVADE